MASKRMRKQPTTFSHNLRGKEGGGAHAGRADARQLV